MIRPFYAICDNSTTSAPYFEGFSFGLLTYIMCNVKNYFKDRIKLDRRELILCALAAVAVIMAVIALVWFFSRKERESIAKKPTVISMTIEVPDDLPTREKERIVYQSLLAAGFSPAGACGMMGNISVETTDFDPTVTNGSNGAFGLFQWTDVGDRQDKLKEFCRENEMNWGSVEGQIAFAVYELSGADPIACRLDELLRKTDDPYTAAAEFCAGFERCIADSGKKADRYMGSIYPEFYGNYYQGMSKRINRAMNYYERFISGDEDDEEDGDGEIDISVGNGILSVYAFEAGAADCFLLTNGHFAVLIDCAEKNDGKAIAKYLSDNGIAHLDYLIISHFDKDHIGGAKKILEAVTVDHILEPDYVKESSAYGKLADAIEDEGVDPEIVKEPMSFELDGVVFEIDPPAGGYTVDESNNSSLIVSVTNKDDRMLFMGDAEDERIREFLAKDPGSYDLLKVPHHGRLSEQTDELIEEVTPRIALITSSDDEPEDYEVVQMLEDSGTEVFLTVNGPVMTDSTGSGIISRTVVE